MGGCINEQLASVEGLEDTMFSSPSLMLMVDEFDVLLAAIKGGKDPLHAGIMGGLLRFYSSMPSVYTLRMKAGKERQTINQPGLTLYATAIPSRFYGSISPKMIENGLLPRMVIMEAGPRGKRSNPVERPLPEAIVQIAQYWGSLSHGPGNVSFINPTPMVIEHTTGATQAIEQLRDQADAEYDAATSEANRAIWTRAGENALRLALNYACSANHESPIVDTESAEWACKFTRHQIGRLLLMTDSHVAESPFEANCNRLMDALRKLGGEAPRWQLNRALRSWTPKDIREACDSLVAQGAIELAQTDAGACQGRRGEVVRIAA